MTQRTDTSRVIMITGGGSGIGQAAAAAFVRAGDRVVILGRHEHKLRRAAAALGPSASWQQVDVSRRESIEAGIAAALARLGRLDVLVNNAGFVRGITTDMPLADAEWLWDEVVDTNLKGAFLIAVAAAASPAPSAPRARPRPSRGAGRCASSSPTPSPSTPSLTPTPPPSTPTC